MLETWKKMDIVDRINMVGMTFSYVFLGITLAFGTVQLWLLLTPWQFFAVVFGAVMFVCAPIAIWVLRG